MSLCAARPMIQKAEKILAGGPPRRREKCMISAQGFGVLTKFFRIILDKVIIAFPIAKALRRLFIFPFKNRHLESPARAQQGGQALVEYVLLLIVVVGILLLGLGRLFAPTQNFLSQLLGEAYIGCLLETGALPTLGGESTIASENGCVAEWVPGEGLVVNDNRRNGRDGSNSGSDSESSRSKQKNDAARSGGGRRSSSSLRAGNSFGSSKSASETTGEKKRFSEGDGGDDLYNPNSSSGGRSTGELASVLKKSPDESFNAGALDDSSRKKINKLKNKGEKQVVASEEVAETVKKKPFRVQKAERAVASEVEDEGFTFGEYLKYLIIICIVIALILVIGGQFLQMTRNLEKKY